MGYIIKYDEISKLYDILISRNRFILGKLNKIEDAMNQFVTGNDFSGQYVSAIKSLFNDVQLPIIKAIGKVYSAFPSYYILYLGELMTIESNAEAILNEELLTELSGELQKALDYIDNITYDTNFQINRIRDIADIDRISSEVFKVNGFGFVKDKIDTLLQSVADIENSFYSSELYKMDNLLDSLTSVIKKMPQVGDINILEARINKLFPLEEINDLIDCTDDVKIDDRKEYIDYIRRLCNADAEYDIKEGFSIDSVIKLINRRAIPSMDDIRLTGDLMEFYLRFCEYCGEKYLYNWTDTEINDWINSYVPNYVNDETLIYVMTLMSDPLDKDTIDSHLQHNRELWLRYLKEGGGTGIYDCIFEDGYVDGQKYLDEMYYGVNGGPISASENACEIIALYNALYSINDGVTLPRYDFPELIAQIEGSGPCLNGILGTSPVIMEEYLKDEGYNIKTLEGKDARNVGKLEELQDEYDTYIVTLYNDENDVSGCVHTMCITSVETDGNIKYIIRNDGKANTVPQDSIYDCLEAYKEGESKTICIIGVGK